MRKILSLVLVFLMVFGIAAVANAEDAEKNTLTLIVSPNPCLDPQRNQGLEGHYVMIVMYEGLFRYSETGIEPAGCTDYEYSEDGLTWTFHLREDAVWTDGKAVTADDYVYSFRRLVDPAVMAPYAIDYGQFIKNGRAVNDGEVPIEELGVKAIDDFTLQVELEAPCAYLPALLCYTTFYPLRPECIDDETLDETTAKPTADWGWDVDKIITNGPMQMVYCDEAEKLTFVKSETYWDAENVLLDELTFLCMDNQNTCLALFRSGEADLTFKYPSEETAALQADGLFHAATALGTGFLLVNCVDGPTTDPNVRKALSLCIDREFLANELLSGNKVPATTFIGSGFPGATDDADFKAGSTDLLTYDPDLARELLAQTEYADNLVIEIPYTNAVPDYQIVFEYLQSTWEEELGATVVLSPMDSGAWGTARETTDFTVTVQNWYADYFDASNMLSIFVTDHSINQGHYSDPKFDELFQASLVEPDNAARCELMHQAEEVLIGEDMGIIPLYHNKKVFIYDDNQLSNVRWSADAFPFWIYIVNNGK